MARKIDDLFNDALITLDRYTFEVGISLGHRVGQAYFNSLGCHEQNILRHTKFDPFYKDDDRSVCKAHSYVLSQISKV